MIDFVKMHGLGNDFMVINAIHKPIEFTSLQIQRLANRRLGVGFDQLLILEASKTPEEDFYCRIFNADGSSAEQCGNGVRCVGRLMIDLGLCKEDAMIRLRTDGGILELQGLSDGNMRVNMGPPTFDPSQIPVLLSEEKLSHQHAVLGRTITFSVVNMGNPHAVMQVEKIREQDVALLGHALGADPIFPQGVNVGFSEVVNPQTILLQVYERGAGETLACGSGACAAVVAGRRLGLLQERVRVEQPGGSLTIEWQGPGQPVWMTGPAVAVYKGVLCDQIV